jgi:GNAT superfamily N-acetyltransferase
MVQYRRIAEWFTPLRYGAFAPRTWKIFFAWKTPVSAASPMIATCLQNMPGGKAMCFWWRGGDGVRGGAFRHAAELVSIAVEPLARGQGVASQLLENTFQRLRLRGVRRVALTVRVGNRRAEALYRRFGFRRERIVPEYYEDGKDGVRMGVRWE